MDKLQNRQNHFINCYSKSLSGPAKSTFKICNYRMRGIYNYRQNQLLQFYILKAEDTITREQLTVKRSR